MSLPPDFDISYVTSIELSHLNPHWQLPSSMRSQPSPLPFQLGHICLIVNNAGITEPKPLGFSSSTISRSASVAFSSKKAYTVILPFSVPSIDVFPLSSSIQYPIFVKSVSSLQRVTCEDREVRVHP